MRLMLISNNDDIAAYAQASGIDTIFIDLEKTGKEKRQENFNTVINYHDVKDIAPVRHVLDKCELMVRVNPLNESSKKEIEEVLAYEPDCLMLPMFETAEDVCQFRDIINGRANVRPLIETPAALSCAEQLADLDGVHSYHFGLNDLHIAFGDRFIFDTLRKNRLDEAISIFNQANVVFGVGGMARLSEGDITGAEVLAEGLGRNSKAVILSRTFHRNSESLQDLQQSVDLPNEIQKIRKEIDTLRGRTSKSILSDRKAFNEKVAAISARLESQQ
jgi:hypothetical protein